MRVKSIITFNWQYKSLNQFYILSFTFHPNERVHDNVWRKKNADGVTWVPSHLEQAKISELLGLANRINGLTRHKREKLRSRIDGTAKEDFEFKLTEENVDRVITAFKEVEGMYEE